MEWEREAPLALDRGRIESDEYHGEESKIDDAAKKTMHL
jgi:hypothetical protein